MRAVYACLGVLLTAALAAAQALVGVSGTVRDESGTPLAGVAIALALVAIHFALSTLTGSSVNPARSIGSAVVGGDLNQLWIYLVGPIVGGIIGWGIYRLVEMTEEEASAAS